MIKQKLEADLKQAMLAGDKELVSVLRTVKSVILDGEIKAGVRDTGLDDDIVTALLQKESKKRVDAATMYDTAGETVRGDKERYEKDVISQYLPDQMDDAKIGEIVDQVIAGMGDVGPQQMGQVIGAVKAKTGGAAEGAIIAKLVKERLAK